VIAKRAHEARFVVSGPERGRGELRSSCMGFQFAETMSGTVEWTNEPGKRHPLRFEITAHADSTRAHIVDGKAKLRGVIHAPPLVDSADAQGEITIRPVGQRIIRYELWFYGDNGQRYELRGQKDIRWTRPLDTFTRLPAEITDEAHRTVGTCMTHFDLKRDWWSFLRSFRPA
jgi:hypothetical protein